MADRETKPTTPANPIPAPPAAAVPVPPPDPAPWLERTERLLDAYRRKLHATAGPSADPGLGFLWTAADHLFERHGGSADFALLEVEPLMREYRTQFSAPPTQFVTTLSTFYAFLAESNVVEGERANAIRAELASLLE